MSILKQKENPDLLKNTKYKVRNLKDSFSTMTKEEGCACGLVDKFAHLGFKYWSRLLSHLELGGWMKHGPSSCSTEIS